MGTNTATQERNDVLRLNLSSFMVLSEDGVVEDSFDSDDAMRKIGTKTTAQEHDDVLRSTLSSSMVDTVLLEDVVIEDSFDGDNDGCIKH